jgi:hypothetical protein
MTDIRKRDLSVPPLVNPSTEAAKGFLMGSVGLGGAGFLISEAADLADNKKSC